MTPIRRRTFGIAGAAIAVLLIYAWVDGGERPIVPIVDPIDVPEGVQ